MKRKPSIYTQLNSVMTAEQASRVLSLSLEFLQPYYKGQSSISLRCLLKRISRENPVFYFLAIGEFTYTLKGVMQVTDKGRSWAFFFISRNNVSSWCVGNHYHFSKVDVDTAWQKEMCMWSKWIPVRSASALYGIDSRSSA